MRPQTGPLFAIPVPYEGAPLISISPQWSIVRIDRDERDVLPSEQRSFFRTDFMNEELNVATVQPYTLFTYADVEISSLATPVSVMLLNVLADNSPSWWALVRYVVRALKIDPKLLSYRANCFSDLPSVLPLRTIVSFQIPQISWFAHHGYVHVGGQTMAAGTLQVFRPARPDSQKAPLAFYYELNNREAKPERAEKLPLEISKLHKEELSRAECQIPLFFSIPQIHNFGAEWIGCKETPFTYPCTPRFFDLQSSENLMYPRFVPAEPKLYEMPQFHPGPALYSAISAPHACSAIMFRSDGPHRHFKSIRESFHNNRIVACVSEDYELAV